LVFLTDYNLYHCPFSIIVLKVHPFHYVDHLALIFISFIVTTFHFNVSFPIRKQLLNCQLALLYLLLPTTHNMVCIQFIHTFFSPTPLLISILKISSLLNWIFYLRSLLCLSFYPLQITPICFPFSSWYVNMFSQNNLIDFHFYLCNFISSHLALSIIILDWVYPSTTTFCANDWFNFVAPKLQKCSI
jgi:hypothetical protein